MALSNICIHPPICANYKFLNWNVSGISGRFRDPSHHLLTVNSKRELFAMKFGPTKPPSWQMDWQNVQPLPWWVDQLSIFILGRWSGPTFNDGNPCSMGILTINPMELGWWIYFYYREFWPYHTWNCKVERSWKVEFVWNDQTKFPMSCRVGSWSPVMSGCRVDVPPILKGFNGSG